MIFLCEEKKNLKLVILLLIIKSIYVKNIFYNKSYLETKVLFNTHLKRMLHPTLIMFLN